MMTFAALALWCLVLIAPETPIGRAILQWTVVRPAARLNRITRGQIMLAILLASGAGLVGWLIGHEAVRLMAMGLPELASWITMFEVTAYLDAIAAIVTAASVTRWSNVRNWTAAAWRQRSARPRAPRRRIVRTAANDDEHGTARRRVA